MAFGDNSHLITTSTLTTVVNDSNSNIIDVSGNAEADAIYFGDFIGGDDSIEGFGKNDAVLNHKKIYDGNNDGIVAFGPNGILDIDRVSSKNAGEAQITIAGMGVDGALRYLGAKEGYHVYADATVRLAGMIEGFVGDSNFDAGGGDKTFLFDTALGLNLGSDTITNFKVGDRIVTTTRIFDHDNNNIITFGSNGVLDLPGDTYPTGGDQGAGQGGQIMFAGIDPLIKSVVLLSDAEVNGVHYYYYGLNVPA